MLSQCLLAFANSEHHQGVSDELVIFNGCRHDIWRMIVDLNVGLGTALWGLYGLVIYYISVLHTQLNILACIGFGRFKYSLG